MMRFRTSRSTILLVLSTILTLTALGVASMSVYAYQVEGVFRYEYALNPVIIDWDGKPINATSTAVLYIQDELNYGLLDWKLARAASPYPSVDAEYGFSVVMLDGQEILCFVETGRSVDPAFDPSLHLDRVVTRITARGIDDGVCNITYILCVNRIYVSSGIRGYTLWFEDTPSSWDFNHTLLTASMTMTNGTITGISYDNTPLERTLPVLLRNPTLIAAKEWLPTALLVMALMIQFILVADRLLPPIAPTAHPRPSSTRERGMTDDDAHINALFATGMILWLAPLLLALIMYAVFTHGSFNGNTAIGMLLMTGFPIGTMMLLGLIAILYASYMAYIKARGGP